MYTKTGLSALAIAGVTFGAIGLLTGAGNASPADCRAPSTSVAAPAATGGNDSGNGSATNPAAKKTPVKTVTNRAKSKTAGGTGGTNGTSGAKGSNLVDINARTKSPSDGGANVTVPPTAPRRARARRRAGARISRSSTSRETPSRSAPPVTRVRALRPAAVAIATGAVFFGGLAGAGALPGPLQHTSAQLGSHLGIHLPGATHTHAPQENGQPDTRTGKPSEPRSNPTNAAPPATSAPVTTTTAPPTVGVGPTLPTTPKLPISVPGTVKLPSSPPEPVITLPSLPLRHLPPFPAR